MSLFESIINFYNSQIDVISTHTETVTPYIAEAAHLLSHALLEDNKILCCSAGVSFAIAQHFSAELASLHLQRPALPCIQLNNSQNIMAACDQEQTHHYFSRQIQALAQAGDVLVIFAFSGQEKSLLEAIQTAQQKSISILLITSGKPMLPTSDYDNIVVIQLPCELTTHQSLTMQFLTANLLTELTEQLLFGAL